LDEIKGVNDATPALPLRIQQELSKVVNFARRTRSLFHGQHWDCSHHQRLRTEWMICCVHAEAAMYRAKADGRGMLPHLLMHDMHAHSLSVLRLETELASSNRT